MNNLPNVVDDAPLRVGVAVANSLAKTLRTKCNALENANRGLRDALARLATLGKLDSTFDDVRGIAQAALSHVEPTELVCSTCDHSGTDTVAQIRAERSALAELAAAAKAVVPRYGGHLPGACTSSVCQCSDWWRSQWERFEAALAAALYLEKHPCRCLECARSHITEDHEKAP